MSIAEQEFRNGWKHWLAKDEASARKSFLTALGQADGSLRSRAFDAAAYMTLRETRDPALLAEFLDRYRDLPTAPAFEAAIALENGNIPLVMQYAERCPSKYEPDVMGPWQRGSVTLLRSGHIGLDLTMDQETTTVASSEHSANFACVFSADSNYFMRFAEMSVRSFRDIHNDGLLVYDIVNPDAEALKLARTLVSQHSNVLITRTKVEAPQKAHFASARFFAAHNLLSIRRIPLFVFDIDLVFSQRLQDVLGRDWDYSKIGLRVSPLFTMPWQKVTVNFVYIPASAIGGAFLADMVAFLGYELNQPDRGDIWWVDQNAALFAYLRRARGDWQEWGARARALAVVPELHGNRDKLLREAFTKS